MSKKSVFLSVICFLLFAIFIAGGCGGGSSHHNNGGATDEAETVIPDIADITESEEYERIMQELEDELASEGITTIPDMHFVFILSGDSAYIEDDDLASSAKKSQIVKTSTTLPQEELDRIASRLKQPYESGDIIVLVWPSAGTIDDLYTALGEKSTYVDPYEELSGDVAQEDLYPEFYAIAKRYNGEAAHYFTYLLPGSKTLLLNEIIESLSDDISSEGISEDGGDVSENVPEDSSSEDDGSISEEYRGLRGEYVFQARRYAAFISWAAHIDSEMEKQKAYVQSSSLIRSAADPSTNLFDYSAQRETTNFDWYSPSKNWYSYGKHSIGYSAQTSETIYAFHNFVERKDYYIVQSDAYFKPNYDKKTVAGYIYTVGAPCWYRYRHSLANAGSYSLFKNAPKNVNRSSTVSDGTSHSTSHTSGVTIGSKIGSKIGFSGESLAGELSAELSAEKSSSTTKGMSYSHSATWTTTEWSLINQCDSYNPEWRVEFYDPNNKGVNNSGYYPDWNTGEAVTAARQRTDYSSEWMWQISDPNPNIKMLVNLYSDLRSTWMDLTGSAGRGYGHHYISTVNRKIKLNQPPHVIITSGAGPHNFGRNGANNINFRFICSGNWTITSSNPDWCYVSENQSKGGDTNAEEIPILFFVEPFTEQSDKAQTREAVLILRNTDTNQIQSVRVVQSNRE